MFTQMVQKPGTSEVKFTGSGYLDLVTGGEYVTVDNNGKDHWKGSNNWTPESANLTQLSQLTLKYQIVGIKENNTTAM